MATIPAVIGAVLVAGAITNQPDPPFEPLPDVAVVESAGVSDILTKTLGTNTPRNVVNAVMAGLSELRDPDERLAQLGRTR